VGTTSRGAVGGGRRAPDRRAGACAGSRILVTRAAAARSDRLRRVRARPEPALPICSAPGRRLTPGSNPGANPQIHPWRGARFPCGPASRPVPTFPPFTPWNERPSVRRLVTTAQRAVVTRAGWPRWPGARGSWARPGSSCSSTTTHRRHAATAATVVGPPRRGPDPAPQPQLRRGVANDGAGCALAAT